MLRKVTYIIILALLLPVTAGAQKAAQKTNLLYWAAGTPNVGLEFAAGRRFSLEVNAGYNPWDLPGDSSMRHWNAHAGIRYWFCKTFESHFISADVSYARFDIGNLPLGPLSDASYRGSLAGGGISYGYHWPVGKRSGLEFTLGVGYMNLEYEKYTCLECTESLGRFRQAYIGPVRLGLSFVYFLK